MHLGMAAPRVVGVGGDVEAADETGGIAERTQGPDGGRGEEIVRAAAGLQQKLGDRMRRVSGGTGFGIELVVGANPLDDAFDLPPARRDIHDPRGDQILHGQ